MTTKDIEQNTETTRLPNSDVPDTVDLTISPLGAGLEKVLHDLHSMSKGNFLDILGSDFQGDLNHMSYAEILNTLEKVELDRKEVRKDFDARQRSVSHEIGIGKKKVPTSREPVPTNGELVPSNGELVPSNGEQAPTKGQIPTYEKQEDKGQ